MCKEVSSNSYLTKVALRFNSIDDVAFRACLWRLPGAKLEWSQGPPSRSAPGAFEAQGTLKYNLRRVIHLHFSLSFDMSC